MITQAKMPRKWAKDFTEQALCIHELEYVKKAGAEYVVYWYGYGCYAGAGALLFLIGDSWYYHNLSHCSCYGPTEHLSLNFPITFALRGDSLEAPKGRFSAEALEEISPLLPSARRYLKIRG